MSDVGNVKKGSLPGWIYKIAGIIGVILILAVVWSMIGGETKELQELKQTPMTFNFDPNKGAPQQLEFKLSGTAQYRGLILTDIKMSDQYPGVIESGTIKNIGSSSISIAHLQASGSGNENNVGYEGYFTAAGYKQDENHVFRPQLELKSGESISAQFKLIENNDQIAYYSKNGELADKVYLNGIAHETGIGSVTSYVKSVAKST